MSQICYVGYASSHPSTFVYEVPENHDWWLLVLTHTPATFFVVEQLIDYPNGTIVLYPPGCKIHYQACNGPYVNDWLRFYPSDSNLFQGILPLGRPIVLSNPEYCHKLFLLLTEEDFSTNEYKEQSVDALIRLLINKMLEACTLDSLHTPQHNLLTLRLDIKNNPGYPWTIPYMAERTHFSEGHFQTLYKKEFQISCMEDVIHNRIQLAKEHLAQSTNPIHEISALCGYQNIEHFSRQFKKLTGLTPTEYRKNHTTY